MDRAIGHVRKCRAIVDVSGSGDEDTPWHRNGYKYLKAIEMHLMTMWAGYHEVLPEVVSSQVFIQRAQPYINANRASSLVPEAPLGQPPAAAPVRAASSTQETPSETPQNRTENRGVMEEMNKLRQDLRAAHGTASDIAQIREEMTQLRQELQDAREKEAACNKHNYISIPHISN